MSPEEHQVCKERREFSPHGDLVANVTERFRKLYNIANGLPEARLEAGQRYIMVHGLEKVTGLPEETVDALKDALIENYDDKAGFLAAVKDLDLGERHDPGLIFDNETHVASEYGELEYVSVAGAKTKTWRCTGESNMCEECFSHEGETVGINKPFSNGEMIAHGHVGCRCSMEYGFSKLGNSAYSFSDIKQFNEGDPIPIQECQLEAEEQGHAIEANKRSDSALSYEYLKAVYDRVMAHPSIWEQIKGKIRVAARGSAGGQLKAKYASEVIKLENSAGGIVETEEHIDVPTVFMKEGVWTGADGTPTLKKYENMKPSANWFMGTPITPHHLKTDTARPTDRRIGQIVKSEARDDRRDIAGVSRFFKSQLTSDELEKIRNLQFPGGSAGYFTPRLSETGEFDGKLYHAVETGPYSVGEYAVFFDGTRAACERADGCGPYQNSAAVESDDVPDLEGGETVPCPLKLKNQGIDDMDSEEFKKLLNEAVSPVTEAVQGITTRIDALEKQLNEAPKLADQPEFKALEDSIKQLNSAMPDIKQFKDDQEAAKDLKARTAFSKLLNAAALEDGKVPDKIWNEAKADPIGFLDEHSEMRLGSVKQTEFTGKILNSDGSEFDLAREQAKLYGY